MFEFIDPNPALAAGLTELNKTLFSKPELLLTVLGVLFLFFGYHSNKFNPIKTNKLDLYLSGSRFLIFHIVMQLMLLLILLPYLTTVSVLWAMILFMIFVLWVAYLQLKINGRLKLLVAVAFIVVVVLIGLPEKIWIFLSSFPYLDWVVFVITFYYATTIVSGAVLKESTNKAAYTYLDYYGKIHKSIPFFQYPIFLYPMKEAGKFFYKLFFGKGQYDQRKGRPTNTPLAANIPLTSTQINRWIGIMLQTDYSTIETEINSFLILIFSYSVYISNLAITLKVLLWLCLFGAIVSIAVEYSINTNGFLHVRIIPKNGKPIECRLYELERDYAKIILNGIKLKKKFNPLVMYPMSEVSRIEFISWGELLDSIDVGQGKKEETQKEVST